MLDTRSQRILAEILQRESASLLCYTGDSFPWTTAKSAPSLDGLRAVVEAESASVLGLGKFLVKNKVTPPPLGSYPAYFTYLNFLALGHLLPKLIESQKTLIAQLELDLHRLNREAAVPAAALLAVKQKSLAALEALQP